VIDFENGAISEISKLLYIAPEHLPDFSAQDGTAAKLLPVINGNKAGDVYRFGIQILVQISINEFREGDFI
jgi:hypothetical protein